jgi:hypothetical protein
MLFRVLREVPYFPVRSDVTTGLVTGLIKDHPSFLSVACQNGTCNGSKKWSP